ncbi:MAG: endonuclease III [Lentisphaerae bacterium]|nr:endonuclease III [Lentisphaerota bacterium]
MKTSLFLQTIHDRLFSLYGECICPLHHDSPFQLLVAVMLSAQCRDERVNLVTEKLFALAPDAFSMSEMPVADVEKIIHPCGLSGSKSRNIVASATLICNKHQGRVPQNMDDLTALPGIGRKSANVILGNCFNIPGFPVDTHVKRVLNRLGAVNSDSPEKIENIVNNNIAPQLWTNFSHLIIQHGRKVCHAAKPECKKCVLETICKKKKVK